jgi:hypothetical protein
VLVSDFEMRISDLRLRRVTGEDAEKFWSEGQRLGKNLELLASRIRRGAYKDCFVLLAATSKQ